MSAAARYIARTGADPMVWGQNDCACWAASLWQEVTGVDPAAELRGTYDSWNACRLTLLNEGGILAVSRRLMSPWAAGGIGDGICVAKTGARVMAGILSGERLWLKTDGAVLSPSKFTLLDQWSF